MRLFTDVLRDYRGGKLVSEMTRCYTELVRAVSETGKKGKVVLTLIIEPTDGAEKSLSADVKVTLPRQSIPDAVFWSDEDGNLHHSDPAQKEMTFEDASNVGTRSVG